MGIVDNIKKDITSGGALNIILYIVLTFILLPVLDKAAHINISLLHYLIWYIWGILYTIYVIYKLTKPPSERNTTIDKVTYNWFIKGGYNSYKDVFILSEVEPLYEYGILMVLLLIPVEHKLSLKRKLEIILMKVAIFHIASSFMLMDWEELVVDYKFRNIVIDSNKKISNIINDE